MKASITKEVSVLFEETVDLNVNDYLNCETIHDLEFAILRDYDSTKNLRKKHSTNRENIKIDKEFMFEWKNAVGFLPNNVMTLDRKNRHISWAEDIKEYDGFELNRMKSNSYSSYDYDFGDYQDFHFNENKRYKVYIYYSPTTIILFAEECGPAEIIGSNVILG